MWELAPEVILGATACAREKCPPRPSSLAIYSRQESWPCGPERRRAFPTFHLMQHLEKQTCSLPGQQVRADPGCGSRGGGGGEIRSVGVLLGLLLNLL